MSKVYLHRSGAPDKLLGRVSSDGRVYKSYPGPDDYVGRVDLESGRVHAQRFGPDEYIGRTDLDTGKVWRDVEAGPDQHLGWVNEKGEMRYDVAGWTDEYIGRIEREASFAEAGAAFLLLVWPAFAAHQ
jgi:hypothetical protein